MSAETVAKSLRADGLRGCAPRPWRTTTLPGPDPGNIRVDRVERRFDQGRLDAVWVGDVTDIRTWEGWLYLATVIGAHSRRVIGWAIVHPDRGVRYTSGALREPAGAHGVLLSVGRTGVCWDNAMAESLFATLEDELIHRHPWPTMPRLHPGAGAPTSG